MVIATTAAHDSPTVHCRISVRRQGDQRARRGLRRSAMAVRIGTRLMIRASSTAALSAAAPTS